ncbi:hypothetical protein ACIQRW_15240 [Streptomyces sp. NPDC091287]|uniref:hypothetical protein n=1 Tax=Streptomyces sp. NPDC091287 TaxID=3365988 RepID=UPI0037F4F276
MSSATPPRTTDAAVDTERWRVPETRAHLVPGFEVRQTLGKKGTRSMDRVTGLTVAAVGNLLEQDDATRESATGERAALVLATTTGGQPNGLTGPDRRDR